MNNKTIYLVVAVLVVIIVVGVAAYALMNQGNNPTPTPTPTPAATIVGASTVQFNVNDTTTAAGTVAYTFAAKNFNTSTEVLRVDMNLGPGALYSYVLDAGQEKSWTSTNNGQWTASTFSTDWTTYGTLFNDYVAKITEKSSLSDFSYTSGESTIDIFCIAANPTLADSLFATS